MLSTTIPAALSGGGLTLSVFCLGDKSTPNSSAEIVSSGFSLLS